MTADEIKVLVMCYWRFARGCYFVAEEFSYGYADVIAFSRKGRTVHETEVKISIADMKADKRKPKHQPQNLFGEDVKQIWANYFYFAVPKDIEEKALKVCQEFFPYAGLLVVEDYELYLKNHRKPNNYPPIRQAKEPQYLQAEKVSEERLFKLARGMSNSLCSKAYKLMRLNKMRRDGT